MPKLSGVNHQRAVKAFQKAGFWIAREGKHITMTNGERIITIPRANPVDAFTMAGIVKDAGLTIEDLFWKRKTEHVEWLEKLVRL
jgi:predicted RNA binding protein YcfA (HicA-like mRNA interferase family)